MRKTELFLLICILLLLAGCWDERLLKNSRTVYLSGFDLNENGDYQITSIIRDMNISESSRGEISILNELVTGKGSSIKEASMTIDRSVPGNYDPAKGRALILGIDVAKGDIYNVLDAFYRDPRVDLNAKIAVTDNSANELIAHLSENEVEKGEYLYELIHSSEINSEIQNITLRSIRTYLFDEGKDFMLPYLSKDEAENEVIINGVALFHDHSFTGQLLTPAESTLLILFMEKKSKQVLLTEQLDKDANVSVSYNVKSVSRKLKLRKEEKVHADILLELDVEIVDYPPDQLNKQERISFLEIQISKILTEKADNLFKKLAANQSDILGLGREIIAFYPSIWEEIKGENYYEQILVNPKVKVNVRSGGIVL
ncbi:Ger(x)C family germination protein [Gracilibacillus halotolerans]|uniref:Ger(X)C family germination protein n=1 Tax=Gracilibacillus halotolerans TaxID=74386 RepID=A0A841RMZ7_9BACI|nr:Ger(x)C family spore germination protein [Gracilibacillus halotolerans]MBB6513262.1 Ger(x)C family germination protein [Gracilibacillus halotolerans]